MRDQEPSDPGEPGHVAVLMDPPHRCLISHTPPSWLRDVLVEGLNLNSSGLLTGTRWPSFQPTVAGVGKIEHHSEWKSIRNNDPLGYLPYMEAQFERVTGYKLVGLGACMEWIRAGTYYHWVIAQQGQLGRCPRLAGVPPPQGPMMPPPYPPVMAAAPPVTVVASTQATVPNPPWGGGR